MLISLKVYIKVRRYAYAKIEHVRIRALDIPPRPAGGIAEYTYDFYFVK